MAGPVAGSEQDEDLDVAVQVAVVADDPVESDVAVVLGAAEDLGVAVRGEGESVAELDAAVATLHHLVHTNPFAMTSDSQSDNIYSHLNLHID